MCNYMNFCRRPLNFLDLADCYMKKNSDYYMSNLYDGIFKLIILLILPDGISYLRTSSSVKLFEGFDGCKRVCSGQVSWPSFSMALTKSVCSVGSQKLSVE